MPPLKTLLAREIADSNATTREIAKRQNVKACRGWPHEADNQCLSDPTSNPEPARFNPPVAAVVTTGRVGDRTIDAESHPAASVERAPAIEVSATPLTDAVTCCGRNSNSGTAYHKAAKGGAPTKRAAPSLPPVHGMVRFTPSPQPPTTLLAFLVRLQR
jgi:hypothetical protein